MTAQTFCPNCGKPRLPGARFCPSCGHGYDGTSESTPSTPETNTTAMLAGLAWLTCAALTGYLAYQQWAYSQLIKGTILDSGNVGTTLEQTALFNAFSAVVTLYFGARILTKPTHRLLTWSAFWAVISVGWGILQISQGVSNDIFVFSLIAAGVAGVLSGVARASAPDGGPSTGLPSEPPPRTPTPSGAPMLTPRTPPPAVSFAQRPPAPAPAIDAATMAALAKREHERTSPLLVLAVILTGVLALVVVGYAVAQGPGQGLLAGLSPTPTPTASPTPTPVPVVVYTPAPRTAPPGGLNNTAVLGEAVDLQNTSTGGDLGSITVVKSKKYTSLNYQTPAKGQVFVAVDVRYDARSAFSYSAGEWVLHDGSGIQYQWTANDPSPALNSGTLAAGRHQEGWVGFQVQKAATHLWIDYQNGDGSIVFTVKLY